MSLEKLLPPNIKADRKFKAAARACDSELAEIDRNINAVYILSRIDELPEPVLDLLAWQFHVEGYDLARTVEEKRALVKSAIELHRFRGTPYAIRKVFEILGVHAALREWFETSGQPYTFEVELLDVAREDTPIAKLIELINQHKNVRSQMARFDFTCLMEARENLSVCAGLSGNFHLPLRIVSQTAFDQSAESATEIFFDQNLLHQAEAPPVNLFSSGATDLFFDLSPDLPAIERRADYNFRGAVPVVEIDTGGSASVFRWVYEFPSFTLSARKSPYDLTSGPGVELEFVVEPLAHRAPLALASADILPQVSAAVGLGEGATAGTQVDTFLYETTARDLSLASIPILSLEV